MGDELPSGDETVEITGCGTAPNDCLHLTSKTRASSGDDRAHPADTAGGWMAK